MKWDAGPGARSFAGPVLPAPEALAYPPNATPLVIGNPTQPPPLHRDLSPMTTGNPEMQRTSASQPPDRAFMLLPQQPQPNEMQAVQEHLLSRPLNPADQQRSDEFFNSLEVTFGDYAPGGENMPGDDAGRVKMM